MVDLLDLLAWDTSAPDMPIKRFIITLFCLLLLVAWASLSLAQNNSTVVKLPNDLGQVKRQLQTVKTTRTTRVKRQLWNLQNANIRAVIAAMSKETGKNFLVDPRVQGNVTIVSSVPMGPNEAYQLFLSALSTLGYSAVPAGPNLLKIAPSVSAKAMGIPIANRLARGDQLMAAYIPIKHVSATELVAIIRPMLPEWSNIESYRPTNALIVAGPAQNINRIRQLVNQMNATTKSGIQVVPLQYTSAVKLASVITNLQSSDRSLGRVSNVSVVADPQSNSILLSGSLLSRIHMQALINKLDRPPTVPGSGTRVFFLNYLHAKKLAPILAKVAKSAYVATESKPGRARLPITTTNATTGTTEIGSGDRKVSIQAEPASNAVIISAPYNILSPLASVIHRLDRKPEQVLVEAIIARVDETTASQLGILWSYSDLPNEGSGSSKSNTATSINNSASNVMRTASTTITNPQQRLLNAAATGIGIITHNDFQAVVAALVDSEGADVLSTPSEVVLNNQKAIISDGVNVGVVNSSHGVDADNNPITPYTTFNRQNVALKLTVTPQISPDDSVQLKIQLNNDTLQNPQNPGDNPVINTSEIATTVLVHSGDILVLGGLVSHDHTTSENKIPLLGDIPVVGHLFRFNSNRAEKKDLMVFIRPVLLNDRYRNKLISNQRYNYMRDQMLVHRRNQTLITPENEIPILPSWNMKKLVKLPAPFPPPGEHFIIEHH